MGDLNLILYIYLGKKTNQTTIFKGDSILTHEQQQQDQHIVDARKRDDELNNKLREMDPNHRGVSYYTRPMYIQSGGQEYTNYFEHENRIISEERVIDWIEQQCQTETENTSQISTFKSDNTIGINLEEVPDRVRILIILYS